MSRPVGESGLEQPLRLELLRNGREGLHRPPRRASRATGSASSVTIRSGKRDGELPVAGVHAGAELVPLPLQPVVLAAQSGGRLRGVEQEQERAVGQQAARPRRG